MDYIYNKKIDINQYFQEENIEQNICRWNLNVHNCKDEAYFRSVYYIKVVVAICVSLLDSVLIIYRIGIKRRNIITSYGVASIDGLLLITTLYSFLNQNMSSIQSYKNTVFNFNISFY
jgi:hypothetical protein